MRKRLTLITILALLLVACGDDDTGGATTTTSTSATTVVASTTTTEPQAATCRRAPGDQPFEEVADGLDDILAYQAGRYRIDQFDPMTHFTIADEWSISDVQYGATTDDPSGFSGLRPETLAAQEAEDPFVGIWPITAWCDVATDTSVVFPPGELVARIEADPRLVDVASSEVTVGSCPATRIDAQVRAEDQDEVFWLGTYYPRTYGDISPCRAGNAISAAGDAAEHVVFWVVDVDGIDLLVNATYPTELAEEFESMLDAFVASIEFE